MPFKVGETLKVKEGESSELVKRWADVVQLYPGQRAKVVVADEGSDFFHVQAEGGRTFVCQYSDGHHKAFEVVEDELVGTTP